MSSIITSPTLMMNQPKMMMLVTLTPLLALYWLIALISRQKALVTMVKMISGFSVTNGLVWILKAGKFVTNYLTI
jgi:hypothetical protein